MKVVKVFVASSSELKTERNEIVDLFCDMNKTLREKEIKLHPEVWEFADSSMHSCRKEDEYLEMLKNCELCFVLFWQKLGEYTVEEVNFAFAERHAGRLPQNIKLLFKEPTFNISPEMKAIKEIIQKLSVYDSFIEFFSDVECLRNKVERVVVDHLNMHLI